MGWLPGAMGSLTPVHPMASFVSPLRAARFVTFIAHPSSALAEDVTTRTLLSRCVGSGVCDVTLLAWRVVDVWSEQTKRGVSSGVPRRVRRGGPRWRLPRRRPGLPGRRDARGGCDRTG